ncbi:MAG TPA: hypothetical protein VEG28_00990 [Dehalococcoidia bacterium]|nr:hypothetical protein [Dehalococcoidia bacterium]
MPVHSKVGKALNVSVYEAVDYEKNLFLDIFKTEDAYEAAKAFLEKRKPNFKGK